MRKEVSSFKLTAAHSGWIDVPAAVGNLQDGVHGLKNRKELFLVALKPLLPL